MNNSSNFGLKHSNTTLKKEEPEINSMKSARLTMKKLDAADKIVKKIDKKEVGR